MLNIIKNLRFSKPSRTSPVYYRQAKRIFVEGVGEPEVDLSQITVYYVCKQDIMSLADTDEVIISDQLKPTVISAVVERLKLQLYGSEVDRESDGQDVKEARYHNVIANPNNIQPNQAPQ